MHLGGSLRPVLHDMYMHCTCLDVSIPNRINRSGNGEVRGLLGDDEIICETFYDSDVRSLGCSECRNQ